MKISIAGAPGAGKASFAKKLNTSLLKQGIIAERAKVVDNYVGRLTKRTGWAYGHFAGYVQNLNVATERIVAEYEALKDHEHIITCGTVFDTLCYAAMHGEVAITKQDEQAEFARARATMGALGMIAADSYEADYTFYLPYTEAKVKEEDRSWDVILNDKVPQIIESYFITSIRLDQSEKENVNFATKIIKEWEQEKARLAAAEDEQRPV